VLGHYVRETGALTWEEAVRKMTGLPAATVGMIDRGYLAVGMAADVVVFDPETVIDHATFAEPTLPSDGIRHVVVNGRMALRDGAPVGSRDGLALRRAPYMPARPMSGGARSVALTGLFSDAPAPWAVEIDLRQGASDLAASGTLRVVDTDGGEWRAERLGILQTALGWASVTALLSDADGSERTATIVVDEEGPRAAAGGVAIVIEWGDAAPVVGRADTGATIEPRS